MDADCIQVQDSPLRIVPSPPSSSSKLSTFPSQTDCIVPVPGGYDEHEMFRTHPSPIDGGRESAIKVENVWKKYENNQPVLMNYNMTVPKRSIYALLGSSGCGKSTILSCVVGQQTWDTGTISVLGSPPSKTKFRVDSRKVGYMPQDLALQPLLTIPELLLLYGRLHGMSQADITSRSEFLQQFLQLPQDQKVIANLSGGQQRRASLAVALLHEPDLIILDEPDNDNSWLFYLFSILDCGLGSLASPKDLVTNLQVTIVLTTHYVDEARRSNMIGLMRHGRIIAEESPTDLMKKFGTMSLDTIVLQICKRDAESIKKFETSTQPSRKLSLMPGDQMSSVVVAAPSEDDPRTVFYAKGRLAKTHGEQQVVTESNIEEKGKVTFLKYNSPSGAISDGLTEHSSSSFATTLTKGLMGSVKSRKRCVSSSFTIARRIRGLIWATYMATFRHPAFIPLTFLLPAITAAMVQFVFGSDLHDLKFGYVNNDEPFSNLSSFMQHDADQNMEVANCLETKFSHLFLSRIPPESLTLIRYASKENALKAVEEGKIWGFVNIPHNYTGHMQQRMLTRLFSEPETIDGTIIGIHLDMSSFLGSVLIIKKLSYAYESYLKQLATSCGLPSGEFELPLKYENPVYGDLDGTYGDHVVPGLILVIIFVLPLGACSVSVIQERNQGSMGRMRVSGMANWDIIITYYVTHGSFQVVQMTLCTLVLVFGFSYVIRGPMLLYVILNACNCFCGLAIGFFLGLVCATELHALIIVFFIASILIPFSGAFWPIECLQLHWKLLAYSLPTTLTARTFRSVVFKGLSYTHFLVWPGLVIPLAWMSVFLLLSLLILRRY